MEEIIAHYDSQTDKKQLLKDHLINTARRCYKIGEKINLGKSSYLIGILHDIGKADSKFQNMILGNTKEKINHSSAGSKILYKNIKKVLEKYKELDTDRNNFIKYNEILGIVIQSHHGIFDLIDTEKSFYLERLKYDEAELNKKYDFSKVEKYLNSLLPLILEDLNMRNENYGIEDIIYLSFLEYIEKYKKLQESVLEKEMQEKDKNSEMAFYEGNFIRLYLSILKNSDIYDTINAYENILENLEIKEKNNDELKKKFLKNIEELYTSFGEAKTELNKVRSQIAETVKQRGINDDNGIYKMNLPTGAGKTYLSLRYGLHQMQFKEKDRFLYITPFLSVLEQNADEIKKVLKYDKNILEHHSNIINLIDEKDETKEEEKEKVFKEYLMDSWESPIVLTTMVQFYQTLFKGKSSNIRRFSSLINSVIVIDEIQSLPKKVTYMSNLILNFLKIIMKANIVLSTATQPKYDSEYNTFKINYGDLKNNKKEILNLSLEQERIFQRVETHLYKDGKIINLDEIIDLVKLNSEKSILLIFNTKKVVKEVYEEIKKIFEKKKIFYLSTNLCAAHRKRKIMDIKNALKNNEKIICVSTQLIEAGVDVDFEVVVRSYAGLDSIVQSIGRCNREGKLNEKGKAYLVNLDKKFENLTKLKEIEEKKISTQNILDNIKSPVNIISFNDKFYENYYGNNSGKNYPIDKEGKNLFDLLAKNNEIATILKMNQNKIYKQISLRQAFKTAADKFSLIENEAKGVIVYYEESKEKIELLIEECKKFKADYNIDSLKEIRKILRELQLFTVNMYSTEKVKEYITEYLNGEILILCEGNYDEELGVVEKISDDFMII